MLSFDRSQFQVHAICIDLATICGEELISALKNRRRRKMVPGNLMDSKVCTTNHNATFTETDNSGVFVNV